MKQPIVRHQAVALALVAAGVAAVSLVSAQQAQPKNGQPAKPAEQAPGAHTVKPEPFRVTLELSGVIESTQTAEVALKPEVWTSFEVIDAVPQGAVVKKGDVLIKLDTEKIDEAIREKEQAHELSTLALRQSEAELALLEITNPMDLEALERASKQADEDLMFYLKIDRPLQEKFARRNYESAEKNLEYEAEELKQLEKMYKEDELTEETEEIILKRQRYAVERAQLSLESAKVTLDRTLETTIPRSETELKLAAKRKSDALASAMQTMPLALNQKRLALEKAKYEHAKAAENLSKLKADRAAMNLTAPMDGVVYYGQCDRGKWTTGAQLAPSLKRDGQLKGDQVVMTIVNPRAARLRASVGESSLALAQPGIAGIATPKGFPRVKLDARLAGIDTVAYNADQYDARLDINADQLGQVLPGMNCSVTLTAYEKADALTVPNGLVQSDDDGRTHYVHVKTDAGVERRSVEIGHRNDKMTEITSGLKAGETVVADKPKDEPKAE